MPFCYANLLVPLDGSEHAAAACRHAISLAACGRARVVLLHCLSELPGSLSGPGRDSLLQAGQEQGKRLLEPAAALCKEAGLECKTLVRHGAAARCIVQTASEERCDLIVMGSRGMTDFSGMLMGSVSQRVIHLARLSVLLVR